jgi:hypothetical protein
MAVRVLHLTRGEVNEGKVGYLDYNPYHRTIPGIPMTIAIAKKLRRSVVIEEHFEFAIRDAHTVKISACAHCSVRLPRTSAIQPP